MQPFTLFNFQQGLDQSREDWLIPDEAFSTFDDGYIDLGYVKGREGYNGYAEGGEGGATYCESRMVSKFTDITAVLSSIGTTSDITIFQAGTNSFPLRRGGVQLVTASETLTDDSEGGWLSSTDGMSVVGTINYTTGLIEDVSFNTSNGEAITPTYQYHPGNPVMMIANYVTTSNVRSLIVADTQFLNRYNSSTNRLDDVSQTYTISGTNSVAGNPTTVETTAPHNLITGMQVQFYGVTGGTELNGMIATVTVTSATLFTVPINTASKPTGGTVKIVFTGTSSDFFHWVNYPDADDLNILVFTNNTDPVMYYTGSLTQPLESNTDYEEPDGADAYDPTAGPPTTFTNLKALRVHYEKDRLVFLRMTWNIGGVAKTFPKRILISGFGANALKMKSTSAGAGQIDLPDERWIFSSDGNRDDLLIFTQLNPWALKYTGNDVVPFVLQRIDVNGGFAGGSEAPMATITHGALTFTGNRAGFIETDGQNIQRADDIIPNYLLDNIDKSNFDLMYSGIEKDDKIMMTLYPAGGETQSSDILVQKYDTKSWSHFTVGFSCLGNYEESFDITWNDLTAANGVPDWRAFGAKYNTWRSIAYLKNSIVTLSGGHKGEIWNIFQDTSLDNPVKIRGITIESLNEIEVTTDYNNYKVGDIIYFTGVVGMVDTEGDSKINGLSATIQSITTAFTVFKATMDTEDTTAYISGGIAGRQIPFNLVTKKFNPFVEQGRQVRIGWMEIFCDVVGNPGDDEKLLVRFFQGDYGEPVDSGYPSQLPLDIVISNRLPVPSTGVTSTQTKMWKKFRINQTGNFMQVAIFNESPLRKFKIHSIRLGMAPGGPLRDQ